MEQKQQNIPEFMKKYYQGVNAEGRMRLNGIAAAYEAERQHFMQTTFVEKSKFQDDWNRLTGQKKRLDPEEAAWHIRAAYEPRVKEMALSHGYVEKAEQQQTQKQSQRQRAETGQKPVSGNEPKERQQTTRTTAQSGNEQQSPSRREQFLESLRNVREQRDQRQNQGQQQQGETQGKEQENQKAANEQTNREKMLAQIRLTRQQITRPGQRPH